MYGKNSVMTGVIGSILLSSMGSILSPFSLTRKTVHIEPRLSKSFEALSGI